MTPKLLRLGSLILLSVAPPLFIAAGAAAAPSVTLTPEFGSGQLGGPGSFAATLTVEGTEYGGFPPPIGQIVLRLPPGTTVAAGDHGTCSSQVLEQTGPSGCKADADAGPQGEASAIVSFGSERVEETATVQSFFAPGGGLNFFVDGHSPVSLEILATATVASNIITIGVPFVSTVPGAPFASIKSVRLRLGESEAEEVASTLVSGVTLPAECPSGRVSWSSRVTFDEGGAFPEQPEPTEQAAESGCIQRQEPLRIQRLTAAQAKQRAEEEAARRRKAEEAELVALRALVKQLQQELGAGVKLERVKVGSHGLLLTLKTSEPGTVSVEGSGLRKLVRALTPGIHRLTITFTKRGRRERAAHRRIEVVVHDKVGHRTVTSSAKVTL